MDNLDPNTFVLCANDPQEPQARYGEYTLQQDLLACNKQYGMDPTQIKDQSSMASLPDRRTTPINPNYGGVGSPFTTSQRLELLETDRDDLDCAHNPYCNLNEDQGAHEWVSGCLGLPRITEELSSHNAPRRSGRVATEALGTAMHQAATAEMAASRAWQAGMASPQAGQLLAAMVKTQARPRRGGVLLRWHHITIGCQFCSSFFAKLYGSKQRSLCNLSLFFHTLTTCVRFLLFTLMPEYIWVVSHLS
ncbi:hypothetical protein IG631_18935 [Alternaria alternata]|nr:hypothetical protein IG631_18935 [Alternaria alternata]